MRYIVILEAPFLVHCLQEFISGEEDVVLLLKEDFPLKVVPFNNARICSEDPLKISTYQKLMITSEDRVILHAFRRKTLEAMLQPILEVCDRVPIVVLITTAEGMPLLDQINVSYLPINEPLQKKIEKEWLYIRDREWTSKIRELTKDAENILILTHDDPDPDALASGVALRNLLGRNRATAPIGSFGKVTRSENLNMMQFLDIRYTIMNPQIINNYSMIAMVDVQPPYFGDRVTKADIIFDHHPQSANYESSFKDIRVEYGATSTILSEYLISNNIKLSQRLATALLYGIKADTLMLEREANPDDIKAFTYLYPLANHNIIRRIEHPSLELGEVNSFTKALKKYQLVGKVLFAHIGRVQKEDIIPRLADFCLQIAGAEWSVVSGLFRGNLVISTRNVGYVKSAGEVVKRIFSDSSIAGGHRTMAKVAIPVKDFKKLLGFTDNRDIASRIQELFLKVLKEDT